MSDRLEQLILFIVESVTQNGPISPGHRSMGADRKYINGYHNLCLDPLIFLFPRSDGPFVPPELTAPLFLNQTCPTRLCFVLQYVFILFDLHLVINYSYFWKLCLSSLINDLIYTSRHVVLHAKDHRHDMTECLSCYWLDIKWYMVLF